MIFLVSFELDFCNCQVFTDLYYVSFVYLFVFVNSTELTNKAHFNIMLYIGSLMCCYTLATVHVREWLVVPQTCLTPPHSVRACPESEIYNSVMFFCDIYHIFWVWIVSHLQRWGLLKLAIRHGFFFVVESRPDIHCC